MGAYSFKPRFVVPIRAGLCLDAPPVPLVRPKRQTIRAIGKRRHARPGEQLQLYQGMRTRDCFLIGRARCISVTPIKITVGLHTLCIEIDRVAVGGGHIHNFAQADGFDNGEDMLSFWREEHGVGIFEGVCIRWEPEA